MIYPKSENPYLELLYSELRSAHPDDTFTYIEATPLNVIIFPFVLALKRLKGYKILHLHWPLFYIDPRHNIPFSKQISFLYSIVCLTSIKVLGYKLVWTVHNVLPHEQVTSNDVFVSRYIALLSSKMIVHSSANIKDLKAIEAHPDKALIIPHGSYIGVYKNNISRSSACKKLGIRHDEFVILFFGTVKSYKGIEDLVNAFGSLAYKNIRLIIAGKSNDTRLVAMIKKAQRTLNIDFYNEYIAEDDVAVYFKAADVVCLPFKAITTSGSALLALSFGRSIITPRMGALVDLPSNVGYLYDPKNIQGLEESLKLAMSRGAKLKKLDENAIKYAKTLSWDNIAKKTYRLYQEILNDAIS